MNEASGGDTVRGLAVLRRFAAPPAGAASPSGEAVPERCELCGEALGHEHQHLVDLRQRSLGCACTACALLFSRPGGRYRTVPDRVVIDPGSPLTHAEWAELRVPVSIAFFFVNSDLGRVVANYPSSAGVTECELDLEAWDRLSGTHPLLGAIADDVEAILVVGRGTPGAAADAASTGDDSDTGNSGTGDDSGTGDGDIETFLVPIDVCYSLAGALRMDWHGFDGGSEVRRILADLMTSLRERARPLTPTTG